MQQFCNSCNEYRDIDIESDCWSCVWDKAEAATEERIIKLLEERLGWVPYGAIGMMKDGQMMSITVEQLIALIKGEK